MNGLCILYKYGNINKTYLIRYFKTNNISMTTRLHENKIRLFGERGDNRSKQKSM